MYHIVVFSGVFFCLLSLLAGVVLGLFDRRASRILHRADAKTGLLLILFIVAFVVH